MDYLINWFLKDLGKSIPIVSIAIGLFMGGVWTVLTFFHKFYADRDEKQFQRYRLLVEELNRGREDAESKKREIYVDYQLNSIYEMRFYRKYFPRTERIIIELIPRWEKSDSYNDLHINDLKATLRYIRWRKSLIVNLVMKVACLLWPWCK
ncbi:hypothetical protein ACLMPM_22825 [Yersinia enterocolitica]|uniref:hypothetical protein n=1 Tax=Yersinia enterocolitica TaxID=630 RepID=UPI00398D0B61